MSEFNIDSNNELRYRFDKRKYKNTKRNRDDDIYGVFNEFEERKETVVSDDDNEWSSKFVTRETKKTEQINRDNIKVVERNSDVIVEEDFRSDINNVETTPVLDKHDEKKLSKEYSKKYGKGFNMLKNMGYKVGKGTGLNEQGITEPIEIQKRQKNVGLRTKEKEQVEEEDEYGEFNRGNDNLLKKKKKYEMPIEDKNQDFEEFEKLVDTWDDIKQTITINPIDISKDLDLIATITSRKLGVGELDNLWDNEICMKIEDAKMKDDIDIIKLLNDKADSNNIFHNVKQKIIKPRKQFISNEEDLNEIKEYLVENLKRVKEKLAKNYISLISNEDKTFSLYYEIFTLRKDKITTSQDIHNERLFLNELQEIRASLQKSDFIAYNFIQRFITLYQNYPAQYNKYRKLTLFCIDIVKNKLKATYRLEDYYKEKDSIIPIINEVKILIDKTTHVHTFEEDQNDHLHIFSYHHKVQEQENLKKNEKIYSYFLSEIVIKDLVNYIINIWNIKEYERLLKIFQIYETILPKYLKNFVIDTAVIPKLREEIIQWDPSRDKNPIHFWIHPWLEVVGFDKLSYIISIVQKKIETPILDWAIDDYSLIRILRPWSKWFTDFKGFLNKYILPKLTAAIAKMTIADDQKFEPLKHLFKWNELIHEEIIAILETHFFPKWVKFLNDRLRNNPSAEVVVQWYEMWNNIFSQHDFIKDARIVKFFYKVLVILDNKFI
jgi:hypothetical protein